MNLPVLYSFRRCPYAMRARLALRASSVQVELREIVLRAKPAHLLSISPKGTVPVLLLANGKVIEQSLDIMRWALGLHDPQGWLSVGTEDQWHAWISLNDGPFKALLDRYKYPERHPERSAVQWRDEALDLMLAPMERSLQRHGQLLGPRVSLADMALLPFVRQFAQVDALWFEQAPLPALRGWVNTHLASPLFASIMDKAAPWQPEQAPLVF